MRALNWILFFPVALSLTLCIPDSLYGQQASSPAGMMPLFDGKTLNGWIDAENGAANFDGGSVTDLPAFARKLTDKPDAVSAYLAGQLDDTEKANLASLSPTNANAKAVKSALVKSLNSIISGTCIYDESRFQNVQLRAETRELLGKNPQGQELARLNKILIEDAYPGILSTSATTGWIVKDGVMADTGVDRGVLYTKDDYSHYRLMFTVRHVSGTKPDHMPCVLFFGMRPEADKKPLDALGAVQFQPPPGYGWDYRPGHNNSGKGEFASHPHPKFDPHGWSRVEILVDASKGTARMAVAQPPGSKAVEVVDFNVPDAGKPGPFAIQIHNKGLFDEYKDIAIEVDPKDDELITVQ
jgi:3-keto-disaccharide hydrolase